MTASRIPQSFIRDLIARLNIVDIVRPRVELKKKGQNHHARCPFHDEKTPSFTVSETKQFYYCFGCGAHGNALDFLMNYDRMEFRDAVEYLAAQQGLEVPHVAGYTPDRSYDALFGIMKQATQYYRQQLKHHPIAIDYLKGRGLTGETAKLFSIGYAPAGWDNLLTALGQEPKQRSYLTSAGMLIDRDRDRPYDRFRQRIIFPIHDLRGRVIAFGGRTLGDDQPKYLNSPETDIFHKSQVLYGLYQARQAYRDLPRLLVVEGYMDVVSLYQHGIHYGVATLGTAINTKHLQLCLRFTHEIVFCFDGDDAGRRAAWKALTIAMPTLRDGVDLKFLFLPDGEDPDSLVKRIGMDAFETQVQQATTLSTIFFDLLEAEHPGNTPASKAALAKAALKYIQTMPQGLYQELLLDELAKRLHVTREELSKTAANPTHTSEQPRIENTQPQPLPDTPLIKHCISLLLHQPQLAVDAPHPDWLYESTESTHQLLLKLLHLFKEHPSLPVGQLLTHWQDEKEQTWIAALAAKEHPFSEDGYQQEFLDTLAALARQHRQHKIDHLISLSKQQSLTDAQRQQLQTLLKTP